jgi:uncharacterized membrane protein YedE/YeeE
MNPLRKTSWSPWAGGVALGVLSWFAFATAGRGLGITTAFESTAAVAERQLAPAFAEATGYFADHDPKIGWEWMLVFGVFLGSALSSRLSGDRERVVVPTAWRARFGDSVPARMAAAFLAGAVMMFGARLAMGCTSGHGITGALQLAVSSWIFIGLAFAAAVATGLAMYGRHPRLEGQVRRA